MTAPERIWARPDYNECWLKRLEEEDVEYVRADLASIQPAQVRVKPLVWRSNGKGRVCADTPFGLYEVERGCYGMRLLHGGSFMQDDLQGIKAAKAAAQADYEQSILSALEPQPDQTVEIDIRAAQVLETCGKCMGSGYGGHPDSGQLCADCNGSGGVEPQPDPRDEVIARLVGALEQFLIEYDEVDLAVPEPQSLISAVMEARAALAAAKAVQK